MTIYTAENSANQEKKALEPDVEVVITDDVPFPSKISDDNSDITIHLEPRRKRRTGLQVCLFLGMILGLCVCIMGSVYLYKSTRRTNYSGWCGVTFVPQQEAKSDHQYLDEDVKVEDQMITLNIREYEAVVWHNFENNVTAIRDTKDSTCYVTTLDRTIVSSPSLFIDFMRVQQTKQKLPEAVEVYQNYTTTGDVALTHNVLDGMLGFPTADLCYTVYRLTLITVDYDNMDSASDSSSEMDSDEHDSSADNMRSIRMYGGKDKLVHYMIQK